MNFGFSSAPSSGAPSLSIGQPAMFSFGQGQSTTGTSFAGFGQNSNPFSQGLGTANSAATDTKAPATNVKSSDAPTFAFNQLPSSSTSVSNNGNLFSLSSKPNESNPVSSSGPAGAFTAGTGQSEAPTGQNISFGGNANVIFGNALQTGTNAGNKPLANSALSVPVNFSVSDTNKQPSASNPFSFSAFPSNPSGATANNPGSSSTNPNASKTLSGESVPANAFSLPSSKVNDKTSLAPSKDPTSALGAPSLSFTAIATNDESKQVKTVSNLDGQSKESKNAVDGLKETANAVEAMPAEYSGLTVRNMLKQWETELVCDINLFESQAKRVFHWDSQLRENEKQMAELTDEVHKLIFHQNQVKVMCDTIEDYQKELNDKLLSLAESLDKDVEALEMSEPTNEDIERNDIYQLTNELFVQIQQMEYNMKHVASDVNRGASASAEALGNAESVNSVLSNSDSTLSSITQILNAQHESIVSLDNGTRGLLEKGAQIKRFMDSLGSAPH